MSLRAAHCTSDVYDFSEVLPCPTCGADARFYAMTYVIGRPEPVSWACERGHHFTPAPKNVVLGDDR